MPSPFPEVLGKWCAVSVGAEELAGRSVAMETTICYGPGYGKGVWPKRSVSQGWRDRARAWLQMACEGRKNFLTVGYLKPRLSFKVELISFEGLGEGVLHGCNSLLENSCR